MLYELILLFILGAAVGSFLTVVVERFDTAESFWAGRSHCNHCKKKLTWWELLPIAGYLILQGKCVKCKKSIPRLYPLFEFITGLAFVGMRLAHPSPVNKVLLAAELLFVSLLLILAFYDWLHKSFPVLFLYTAFGGAVLVLIVRGMIGEGVSNSISINDPLFYWLSSPTNQIRSALLGLMVGAGALGLLAFPSGGKWMGYGDVILAGILGLWLGYPYILFALVIAFYAGAFIGGWLLYGKKIKDHRIAFGPFLIVGSLVSQVWGQGLFRAIMQLWGVT